MLSDLTSIIGGADKILSATLSLGSTMVSGVSSYLSDQIDVDTMVNASIYGISSALTQVATGWAASAIATPIAAYYGGPVLGKFIGTLFGRSISHASQSSFSGLNQLIADDVSNALGFETAGGNAFNQLSNNWYSALNQAYNDYNPFSYLGDQTKSALLKLDAKTNGAGSELIKILSKQTTDYKQLNLREKQKKANFGWLRDYISYTSGKIFGFPTPVELAGPEFGPKTWKEFVNEDMPGYTDRFHKPVDDATWSWEKYREAKRKFDMQSYQELGQSSNMYQSEITKGVKAILGAGVGLSILGGLYYGPSYFRKLKNDENQNLVVQQNLDNKSRDEMMKLMMMKILQQQQQAQHAPAPVNQAPEVIIQQAPVIPQQFAQRQAPPIREIEAAAAERMAINDGPRRNGLFYPGSGMNIVGREIARRLHQPLRFGKALFNGASNLARNSLRLNFIRQQNFRR